MPIKLFFGGLFVLLSSKKKKIKKKIFELKSLKKKKKNCNRASPPREKNPNINPKQNQPQPDF